MIHKINHANIKEWAKNYDGPQFDGILCDPPYELGFMGKSWDSSGIAFDVEMWADLFRHIKPGGHLLAFSGSRTYHRMAVAIEDAGFEIRDMIEWVYSTGFPKSLNIGKAVKALQETGGSSPKNLRKSRMGEDYKPTGQEDYRKGRMFSSEIENDDIKEEINNEWEGYGTALKPAHEPCVLARKPIEGTVANNVLKHGTGGLNIDGTRVGTETMINQPGSTNDRLAMGNGWRKDAQPTIATGRFPANLIHDGSDEVEAVFPQSKGMATQNSGKNIKVYTGNSLLHSKTEFPDVRIGFNDNGSASRFFYCAKASKSERNAGLEGFELKEPPASARSKPADGRQNALGEPRQNHHPTVKPLSLTKYLATLIKPPTGGRLLVPFSGSGSEMIGALQAGWEYVEGVELTEEYIPISEARIKYWTNIKEEKSNQMELI